MYPEKDPFGGDEIQRVGSKEMDSFVPDPSKGILSSCPTLAQGRLDPKLNPILAKNGPIQ